MEIIIHVFFTGGGEDMHSVFATDLHTRFIQSNIPTVSTDYDVALTQSSRSSLLFVGGFSLGLI